MKDERLADLEARLDAAAKAHLQDVISLRRHMHQNPEIGWHEFRTQAYLKDWLADRGMTPRVAATTGLYVDLGPTAGSRVLYRGDMDALPVVDTKDPAIVPYASTNPGVCHACGHDAHTSIAAGVAASLKSVEDELPCGVRVIFQPAEEVIPSGAAAMVADGVAEDVVAGLAVHVDPSREVGTVGVRSGALTSSTDTFDIRVIGKSGHSARPYLARDAVLAAADIIRALYTLIPQRVDPLETAVLSVGTIQGGKAKNVISGEVQLGGTVRSLSPKTRDFLLSEIPILADALARANGCEVSVTIARGAPPVMNDAGLMRIVAGAAGDVLGADHVETIEFPSTGAEDFGIFGDHTRIFMLRLGCRVPGTEPIHLHAAGFDLDERTLGLGIRIMGRAMLRSAEDAVS